ncbi:MAG: helix-turn-helix domain-containing protein [Pirellulaceae bacterium]
MQIVLKLEQYVEQAEQKGISKSVIADKTGLSIYQLNHLIRNDSAKIDRRNLAKFCSFLVDEGLEDRSELPAVLFASKPDEFWAMLSGCHTIELCMGVRRDNHWHDKVVIAADSMIQANVLYRLTEFGRNTNQKRQRQIIDQSLVPTWQVNGVDETNIQQEAESRYEAFLRKKGDRAIICFGSMKSNPIIELSVAGCFKDTKPFESQDNVPVVNKRTCPFLFIYRPDDSHPPSCCGGLKLSDNEASEGPGIYYEDAKGEWIRAACDENSDVALVFYRFDIARGQHDVVLGGYSGRGTRCLAEYLRHKGADEFWPPIISRDGLEIGVYIVQFNFRPDGRKTQNPDAMDQHVSKTTVTPLSEKVLEPRAKLPKQSHSQKASRTKAR